MAKKMIGFIKLQIPAGKANPAPPVGPALGQHGVNIMEFCKAFNAKTQEQMGKINGSQINHKLTTNLYRKHLNMFRIALGKS